MKHAFGHWWLAIRPKTLLASIGPILLGTGLASSETSLHLGLFCTTLACAVLLQISVNLANDLFDSLSGVDTPQRLGPVRAVQSGLISISAIKVTLSLACSAAIACGLYLIVVGGWPIVLLGLLSLVGVFAYSAGPWPLASNALGEVTVLIFFGWVAVLGSFYLQTGFITPEAFAFATCAGLYSSAIMLVNNIRDISTDQQAGKVTLAVVLGDQNARYALALVISTALIIHLILALTVLPLLWLSFVLLLLPSGILIRKGFTQHGQALNQLLAQVAQLGFLYCLSVGLLWFIVY
ncbi:MAG: 1,4-dihydroxy-2-naphthoate octaprenyltransferase [Cognaticolwellia sp.]